MPPNVNGKAFAALNAAGASFCAQAFSFRSHRRAKHGIRVRIDSMQDPEFSNVQ